MKSYFLPEGSSLVLFSFGIYMYTGQPNILRWMTFGFSLEKLSSWFLLSSNLWGVLFHTYTIVLAASAQRWIGRSWSCGIAFDASIIVRFFHFATPFCWGLYGVLNSLLIPDSLQSSLNSSKVNSPSLYDHRVLIFLSVWFSTKALYSLNLQKTSLFPFKKYFQLLREKTSIKET